MKRWIWILVAFLALLGSANAAPIYERLACRDDDPFVFCTQGCKSPDKNWIPTSPSTGMWMATPGYCLYPTTGPCCVGTYCLMSWTQTAVNAVYQYERICPVGGGKASDWKGRQRPENVPKDH
ncbi:hypothetical protein OZ12_04525 [Xanthomonas translucens pv. translucens]|nr:hypothetical protein OZ12_04525 [Xanthomonas translucens pv. translucens]MCC8448193.1 hypothetical protein [Xanthomonas translucens pv. translucens]MQS43312.1 hypothetical protein [Xanthomonas translucens pv. translucens]